MVFNKEIYMRIIKALSLAFLLLAFAPLKGFALPVGDKSQMRPSVTEEDMAFIFYKITAQLPDFEAWIENMPEYRNANEINKVIIADREKDRLENIYRNVDVKSNITTVFPAEISQYSEKLKGYFLADLNEDLFFTYRYRGESFALIPQSIKDYQFVPVGPEDAKQIEAIMGADRAVLIELTLAPEYGDAKEPLEANKEKFWLTLASVVEIRIWGQDLNKTLLWQSSLMSYNGETNGLMDLYQAR